MNARNATATSAEVSPECPADVVAHSLLPATTTSLRNAAAVTAATFVFAAIACEYASAHLSMGYDLPISPMAQLVAGTGLTPFQYRVLVPWLFRGGMALLGLPGNALPQLAFASEATFFFVFLVAIFLYVRRTVGPVGALTLALLSAPLMLVQELLGPTHWFMLYDTPAAALFALALLALSARRWGAYYVLFVIATLNRETTFLLTGIMLFGLWDEMNRRKLLGHVAAQAAIWVVLKATLAWLYRNNPGAGMFELRHHGLTESHAASNLLLIGQPLGLILVLSIAAGLWLPLLAFGKRIDDPLLRWAPRILCAYTVALFFIGNLWESRMFAEFTMIAVCGVAALLRQSLTALRPSLVQQQ